LTLDESRIAPPQIAPAIAADRDGKTTYKMRTRGDVERRGRKKSRVATTAKAANQIAAAGLREVDFTRFP
jgi:hypothetical protein